MQETDYLKIANEPGLWLACSFIILVVIFQALVFMKKAWKSGEEMGLAKEQMKAAIRSGAITTIGPAIAIVIALVSLMAVLGGPFAWMRLSVIGSVPFELMAAETGAEVVGASMGDGYTAEAFGGSVWACTLGALGWLIFCILFADKFDVIRKKAVRGNDAMLPILSVAAMIGAFAYFGAPYLTNNGPAGTVSYLTGAAVMLILHFVAKGLKAHWLNEWALGIAMVCGMATAMLCV